MFRSDLKMDAVFATEDGLAAGALKTEVELEEWDEQVQEATEIAKNDMGVTFMDVDVQVFKDAVADVQQNMLDSNPDIADLYEHIQEVNAQYAGKGDD